MVQEADVPDKGIIMCETCGTKLLVQLSLKTPQGNVVTVTV